MKAFLANKKVLTVSAVIILIAGGLAYALTRPVTSPSGGPTTTQSTAAGNAKPSNNAGTTNSAGSNSAAKTNPTTVSLVAPSGDFVSNHTPSLSRQPNEDSVCITTAGATCYISFSKSGQTKKLPAEIANDSGAASWNWKLQDYGLTQGSWQIKAVATLNGQSKTTNSSLMLDVQP